MSVVSLSVIGSSIFMGSGKSKTVSSDVGYVPLDSGHDRLRQLGYKQELNRHLSYATLLFSPLSLVWWIHCTFSFLICLFIIYGRVISNFAFSFSIISVLTGVTTLYNTGLNYGGPVSFVYGWFIASGFTMIVALSMAEICSSYPTSGGLYYWSAKLAGPRWAPFASWITGWYPTQFLLILELLLSFLIV